MVVVEVEMKEELVVVKALMKVKRKMKWKGEGRVFIGFGICEGVANNKKGGAYLQSGG